jgi:uncharacterized membrane protein
MKKGGKMIYILGLVLICVVMGGFGQIYMKKGLKITGGLELNQVLSKKLISTLLERNVFIGFVLYVLASVLWLVVLSKAEVSYVYPLIALGYVVTALLAKFYFPLIGIQSENITYIRWFGILLILGGVFLVTRS